MRVTKRIENKSGLQMMVVLLQTSNAVSMNRCRVTHYR